MCAVCPPSRVHVQARMLNVSVDPMAASAQESARGRAPASSLPPARHFPLDGYIPSALAKVGLQSVPRTHTTPLRCTRSR